MRRKITYMLLILIALMLTGTSCRQNQSDQEIIEKGAAISGQLLKALMTELNTEIQKNGVPAAIDYCSLHAIPITDSISRAEEVEISRVSHRYRNPSNAANNKEIEMIERYISQQSKGEELLPQVVTEKGQKIYYGPILLAAPLCLKCHGPYNEIDADVKSVLNEKYPSDLAVDFNLNEVRGMFKIRFDS
jgi:hypothetical protein